jgi:hypothetical protein
MPHPYASDATFCDRSCRARQSSVTCGKGSTRVLRDVFGALSRKPVLVSSRDRTTDKRPPTRSRSRHIRPSSSPLRRPVVSQSRIGMYNCVPSAARSKRPISSALSVSISPREGRGGLTSRAALNARSRHLTACCKAAVMILWMCKTRRGSTRCGSMGAGRKIVFPPELGSGHLLRVPFPIEFQQVVLCSHGHVRVRERAARLPLREAQYPGTWDARPSRRM